MTNSINQSEEITFVAPICSIFRRFLKSKNLKFTTERARMLDVILTKENIFEVEELIDDIKSAGFRISKATVYRTIKHLVEAGIIREVLLDSKQAHYQLVYGRKPMDHLVCVDSEDDEVIEFHSPEMIELRNKICEQHGLDPVGHRLLIYGIKKGG